MIDNRGYLYPERKENGYENLKTPITVNCCGSKCRFSRDYLRRRPEGRADYQLLYVYNGTGHYLFSDGWRAMNAGSLILYKPGETVYWRGSILTRPFIYTGCVITASWSGCGLCPST